jgi:hypothetical protein
MLGCEGNLGWEWVRYTKVTVLPKDNKSFCFLGNCFSHKACIVIETVDVTFVAGIEENWACERVPISVINEVSLGILGAVAVAVKVVDVLLDKEFLRIACEGTLGKETCSES